MTKLAQHCMMHQCNKFCLRESKLNCARHCRVGYGSESEFGKQDTPGMPRQEQSQIVLDDKGIHHFRMRRTRSVRLVQHSRTLLQGWWANSDIKLLLYFTDPHRPDINEIDEICRYVVAYTGKKHQTSKNEKSTIEDLIMR